MRIRIKRTFWQQRLDRGITLVEILIVVLIISIVFALAGTAIRMLNSFSRQQIALESQREVEIVLYQLVRNVRNCARIEDVTNTKLVLQVYDLTNGYDINDPPTNLFYNNTQTVTYEAIQDGDQSFLLYTREVGGTVVDSKRFLKNLIATSSVFFVPVPAGATSNYEGVLVSFEIKPNKFKIPARTYQAQGMIRRTVSS
jgi:prepilin-type N-terminal cleavage/methylation domain-containing protein